MPLLLMSLIKTLAASAMGCTASDAHPRRWFHPAHSNTCSWLLGVEQLEHMRPRDAPQWQHFPGILIAGELVCGSASRGQLPAVAFRDLDRSGSLSAMELVVGGGSRVAGEGFSGTTSYDCSPWPWKLVHGNR